MDKPRLKCIAPGCENIIQHATARRTGGYCGPCHGRIANAEREQYVRQHRRDVDLYEGITDPVEIIEISHEFHPNNPLINYLPTPRSLESLYEMLTLPQAERLMAVAVRCLRSGESQKARSITRLLAAFTIYPLDPLLNVWLEADQYPPAFAFRSAGAAIRDRILRSLRQRPVNGDHALQSAAWIGDDAVLSAFLELDSARPPWVRRLYIPPSSYARVAGWEISGGARRDLSLDHCFAIHPTAPATGPVGVRVFQEGNAECIWCDGPLVNLLHIGRDDAPYTLFGLSGSCIEVATCPLCTCFGPVFAKLDADGHGHWANANIRPPCLPEGTWCRSQWSQTSIKVRARGRFHAADAFLPTSMSQIGGLPAWEQDPDYPNCSECGKTMLFIAQIDEGHFPLREGMYYAFLCTACRVTATVYQQT